MIQSNNNILGEFNILRYGSYRTGSMLQNAHHSFTGLGSRLKMEKGFNTNIDQVRKIGFLDNFLKGHTFMGTDFIIYAVGIAHRFKIADKGGHFSTAILNHGFLCFMGVITGSRSCAYFLLADTWKIDHTHTYNCGAGHFCPLTSEFDCCLGII